MANLRNRFPARRRFLKQSAALTASASIAAPVMALAASHAPADPAGVRVGEPGTTPSTEAARDSRRRQN